MVAYVIAGPDGERDRLAGPGVVTVTGA
jgi:hypothetical protein